MADLLELRTRSAERNNDTGFTTNDEVFYDQSINDAIRELSEKQRIRFDRATTSSVNGAQRYTYPIDYMALYADDVSLIYTDVDGTEHKPRQRTYAGVRRIRDLDTEVGTPNFFWLEEGRIGFYPTPDFDGTDNIRLEYYCYPPLLVLDTDVTVIPEKFKYVLVDITCKIVNQRNELFDVAERFRKLAVDRLRQLESVDDEYPNEKRNIANEYLGETSVARVDRGGRSFLGG